MDFIVNLAVKSVTQVLLSLQHNWPYLLVSVVIASVLTLYVDGAKVSAFLQRYRGAGVFAATLVSVTTPLCSCGTTAVILGMMASKMSWAPIIAFMVSSPLSSPEGLVYSAGLFGWPFATAFYISSIILGLAGGGIATIFESRGWLANQTRFSDPEPRPCACSATNTVTLTSERAINQAAQAGSGESCGCGGTAIAEPAPRCGCGAAPIAPDSGKGCEDSVSNGNVASTTIVQAAQPKPQITLIALLKSLYSSGKTLLIMFLGFAFIGYFLNGLIPAGWVMALFGAGNFYSVPLAATLGLPLYINSEASLPLIRALLDSGMSQGAAMAFLIVGSGTSVGAVAGALTIARWRVIALVVGVLWVGAILSGFTFDLLLAWGIV